MSYHLSYFINQQCYGKVTLYFAFGLFSYKKKKNLCCWFKNLRYWTCLTWSKYCSSPSWKRWCYSSRLRSTCVFDQTMTLFCEWIFWTITTSAYPGHWGSSIDFSHWVLWLFQIFICPLLLDSSTSLGLPVTNILDHRS